MRHSKRRNCRTPTTVARFMIMSRLCTIARLPDSIFELKLARV